MLNAHSVVDAIRNFDPAPPLLKSTKNGSLPRHCPFPMPSGKLRDVPPPSRSVLEAFIGRHEHLLQLERVAEEEQTRLLNSKCSPKLLEQRGLALLGLGVGGISVGLGGKK